MTYLRPEIFEQLTEIINSTIPQQKREKTKKRKKDTNRSKKDIQKDDKATTEKQTCDSSGSSPPQLSPGKAHSQ